MRLCKRVVWLRVLWVGITLVAGGSAILAGTPKRGGRLVVAHGADHRGLEPHYAIGWETLWLSMTLYNGLVGLNEKYEVVPEIAKSWEVSADGLPYFKVQCEDVWLDR